MRSFLQDEKAWADFFITRVGLILFASILLLSAFKVYPMVHEKETGAYMDIVSSDIVSRIEAVDSTTIPGQVFTYLFNGDPLNTKIEISTEYVTVHQEKRDRDLIHAEPIIVNVFPPNSRWNDPSGLRQYLGEEMGASGDISSPIDQVQAGKVRDMFASIKSELARKPFEPDLSNPIFIEKVVIYQRSPQDQVTGRDYVLIYQ